eukprot:5663870-Ditylum_brightwellii.AAC.1
MERCPSTIVLFFDSIRHPGKLDMERCATMIHVLLSDGKGANQSLNDINTQLQLNCWVEMITLTILTKG